MSPIQRGAREGHPGIIFDKSTEILAYADDIDIIGLRLSYVAETYQGIEQAAENLGLQINEAKTKLMVPTSAALPINHQILRRCDVLIGERTFEVVNSQFTYLGSKVSNDNSMVAELRARLLAANRSFYRLKIQFTSKNLSRRTKLELHSTYIVPILKYASETGTLSKSDVTIFNHKPRSRARCSEGYLAPYVWKNNGGATIMTSYTRYTATSLSYSVLSSARLKSF